MTIAGDRTEVRFDGEDMAWTGSSAASARAKR